MKTLSLLNGRPDSTPLGLAALVVVLVGLVVTPAGSQDSVSGSQEAQPLVVGTKISPPFSMKDEDGAWSGISIELWDAIAGELGFDVEYRELELAEMFDALDAREIDAGVAALTITAEREERIDFSHSYFSSGLGIAVPAGGGSYLAAIRNLISWRFIRLVLFLLAILAAIGLIVWFFERRRNPDQFGGSVIHGVGSGLWWSAVTMTTVGYGDKAPVTLIGRTIGLVWMFASLLAISAFTAAIASVITVSQLESSINGPEDLPRAIVGTVANSTSQAYLRDRNISANPYTAPEDGVRAVGSELIDAFVFDKPILRYLANRTTSGGGRVHVLPVTFEHQQYGFALQAGSPHREEINRAMLEILDGGQWREIVNKYLGD